MLLADEPTSALDVAVQRQVVQEMLHVRELFGTAIIIVTHDIGVVSAMADTVLVLKDGNKMEYGPAKEVLEHPQNIYTKNCFRQCRSLEGARTKMEPILQVNHLKKYFINVKNGMLRQ